MRNQLAASSDTAARTKAKGKTTQPVSLVKTWSDRHPDLGAIRSGDTHGRDPDAPP